MMAMRAPLEIVYTYLNTIMVYFRLNYNNNIFVYHPNPKNIGADFTDKADLNGVQFIYEITKVTTENGEGYIEYSFPKPNYPDLPFLKKSFGKYHTYWNYVIATGTWIDDIDNSVAEIRNKVLIGMIVGIIISILLSYYMSKSIINPIKQVRDRILKMSEGKF